MNICKQTSDCWKLLVHFFIKYCQLMIWWKHSFYNFTYLHHCFLFSLCWVRMMKISFCSLFIQKGVRALANQNFDWTGKRWFSTVNWACKLTSTNHRSLILKHGYPFKSNAVFEKLEKNISFVDPFFFGKLHFYLSCLLTLRTYINTLYMSA